MLSESLDMKVENSKTFLHDAAGTLTRATQRWIVDHGTQWMVLSAAFNNRAAAGK